VARRLILGIVPWQVFGSLLHGVPLVVVAAQDRTNPEFLAETVHRFGVSRLTLVRIPLALARRKPRD